VWLKSVLCTVCVRYTGTSYGTGKGVSKGHQGDCLS